MNTKRALVLVVLSLGVAAGTLPLVAADLPMIRQPNDPAFSAADRSALSTAWTAIERLLKPGYDLPRIVAVSGRQWTDADYVQFAAGALQSAGYTPMLATGAWAGVTRTWALIGVPVSLGMTYIPVEAAPALLVSGGSIGQIAWQGGVSGTSFDARYLTFTQATAIAPNMPPAVSLSPTERYVVVDETTALMVIGADPDGVILFFDWTFSNGTRITDVRATLWHTFRETGRATVNVTAVDARGARTNLSLDVEVLAERPDCGCGH